MLSCHTEASRLAFAERVMRDAIQRTASLLGAAGEDAPQTPMPRTPPAGTPHTPGMTPGVFHIPTSPQK